VVVRRHHAAPLWDSGGRDVCHCEASDLRDEGDAQPSERGRGRRMTARWKRTADHRGLRVGRQQRCHRGLCAQLRMARHLLS
jgi:hypothetical protein